MPNNIIMADAKDGGILYDEYAGIWYPKILDISIASSAKCESRYAGCKHLEEATIRNYSSIGASNAAQRFFDCCPNLKKIRLMAGCGMNSYIAESCPKLSEVTLGSVGHAVTGIYSNAFRYSGASAETKTITVYVSDSASLPFASAPWGLTGATVIYRSATTGEVIEV